MKITKSLRGTTEKRYQNRYHKNDYNCPKCGGNLVTIERKNGIVKNSWIDTRYNYFEACSNYPRCKFSRKI